MATGIIASRGTKVGAVIKHEYEPATGYCREEVTVTVPADGLQVGAVLESTSVSGKYTLVTSTTDTDADAVLIDPRIDGDDYVDGDFTLAVLVKGPAQVALDALSYDSSITDTANIVTALEAIGIECL